MFRTGSISTFVLDQPGALPPSPILERLLPLAWCLSRVDADSSRCSRCRLLHAHFMTCQFVSFLLFPDILCRRCSLRAVLRASRSDLHRNAHGPVRSLLDSYSSQLQRDCALLSAAFKIVVSKDTADKCVDARPRMRNSSDQ